MAKSVAAVSQVSSRNSGYTAEVADWKRFLACWRDGFVAPRDTTLASMLQGEIRPEEAADDRKVIAELDNVEKRLGVKLPKSYRDFAVAFAAANRPAQASIDAYGAIFPVSQIGFVRDLSPMSVAIMQEYPVETPDSQYFLYGTEQNEIYGRTSYYKDAILIGKYGSSSFEEILLYPQVLSQDGEMEAGINFHAGSFRATSFAELMRQLGFREVFFPPSMPPYSQEKLRGTCAHLLPLRDVWWP